MSAIVSAPATVEPPYITFLRDFVRAVQAKVKDIDLNSKVRYEFKQIGVSRTALVVWFLDGDDPDETDDTAAKFEITVGKRYYGENIINVKDLDEQVSCFMQ